MSNDNLIEETKNRLGNLTRTPHMEAREAQRNEEEEARDWDVKDNGVARSVGGIPMYGSQHNPSGCNPPSLGAQVIGGNKSRNMSSHVQKSPKFMGDRKGDLVRHCCTYETIWLVN